MFNIFNNNDGVVHNKADCKHHCKKGQCVDREIEQHKCAEGTDEGHGHGEQRNECRTPALQKDKDNEHDEQQCLHKGMHNLCNRRVNVVCAVKNRLHLKAGWEIFLCLIENLTYLGECNHCICIRGQLNPEADCGIAVKFRHNIIAALSRFDPRNIL